MLRLSLAFSIILTLIDCRDIFATAQALDRIRYESRDTHLLDYPLDEYLWKHRARVPNFFPDSTTNYKAYYAGWEIRDSKLLLTHFAASVDGKPIEIDRVIPGAKLPLHADWFYGRIHIITGKPLEPNPYPVVTRYESIDILEIAKGVVVQKQKRANVRLEEVQPFGTLARTFSIVAVDPETGICGAAVASKYPAVGKVVPIVRAGVGAFCTQHYCRPEWREPAIDLLAKVKSPSDVLATLLAEDREPGERQLAIIDMKGVTAVHNPTAAEKSSEYWGAMSGRFYSCQGNTLAGRDVIVSMAKAYEVTKGSLADRLMAALIAGDCAGGDHRGRLAAGIRVAKTGVDGTWLELDIDESDDAVRDLARKYAELKHEAKGEWRGAKLPFEFPCPPNAIKPVGKDEK